VRELLPGVYRWDAPHPDWTPEDAEDGSGWEQVVSSYLVETANGPVLIDPLAADDGWDALDRALAGRAPDVLLTLFWHTRSTPGVLERYPGATAWAHEPALELVRERGVEPRPFLPGDPLPGGIVAVDVLRAYEVAFFLPDHGALAVGDVLLGTRDGGARPLPPSWFRGDYGALRAQLRDVLLALPVEHLLLTHGEPVLGTGREALERALHSPPSAA
jgi:glyoxylase-like metal-dependent hydrolase (beta-lactamase superfamily II)